MKTLITLTITFFISIHSFSQLGIKGGFSLTRGTSSYALMYLGGNVGVTYDFTKKLRGEVLFEGVFNQSDHIYIDPYDNTNETVMQYGKVIFSSIPITLGFDYRFFTGIVQPYAGLNAGVVSLGSRTDFYSASSQYFVMQPKIGINVDLTENLMFDFAIKNHIILHGKKHGGVESNILGFNIGVNYIFELGKNQKTTQWL